MKSLENLWRGWNDFWFEQSPHFALSVFRCGVAFTLLIMYSMRAFDFNLYFTNQGLLPLDSLKEALPPQMVSIFPFYISSETISGFIYSLFLLGLVLLTLGLLGRGLTFFVFLLHLAFIQRNPLILYGADLISTFWLFYLSFANHNRYLSLYNLFKKRDRSLADDIVTSAMFRLIQIQLCIVYAYTGMEKLKGDTWWQGSAVWYVMGNENIVPFDLSFFFNFPWAIALMTFMTLAFEIYFPLAVWQKPLRRPWLIIGLVLHGLVALFMGLYFFSLLMLLSYVLFVNQDKLKHFVCKFLKPIEKFVG